jgi:hypothetical protein
VGFEPLIDGLNLPDQDDRHVLAAAICGRAQTIVTANLKDFPAESLQPFGIEALGPDDFLQDVLDLEPLVVRKAIRDIAASRMACTESEVLDALDVHAPVTSAKLRP